MTAQTRRIGRSILRLLTAALFAVLLVPGRAWAAGGPDPTRASTLTITYMDDEQPLTGAGFSLYLAATLDAQGSPVPTGDFAGYDFDFRGENDKAWSELAATLEAYVQGAGLTPLETGITDAEGRLTFPVSKEPLPRGIYLVLGSRHLQNYRYYDAQPFLVSLPLWDGDSDTWSYAAAATPKFTVTEASDRYVTRKVLKVWEDEGHEEARPREITVQLLRDGTVFDTVNLSEENDWRYTWEHLDINNSWQLRELPIDRYTMEITRNGITFVVTNTYDPGEPREEEPEPDASIKPVAPVSPAKPSKPARLPQSGQLWWPVFVLLAAGILFTTVGFAQRRGAADEE